MLTLFLALAAGAVQTMESMTREHDEGIRSQNAERDWWLVSTTGEGQAQHRFYVDRNNMVSMQPASRAWVDHYELVRSKTSPVLSHDKMLLIARCDDDAPQIMYKTLVHYPPSGAPTTETGRGTWMNVVPESSQQTLWRFICHSEPANAIVYVPDNLVSDARRYFRAR